MKIQKTILFLCFFLFVKNLSAQSFIISGQVNDSNASPIEFANVFIQKKDSEDQQDGTITDADGAFKLSVAASGNYEIKISFIGFENFSKNILINESLDLGKLELKSTTNELGEVVVKSTRKIMERKEGKLIFNIQASPLKSGFDGMEVLQRSPNILVDENGGIIMRNEAATVLINGKILNLSGDALANYLRNINSDQIKKIEIQTHLSANTDAESSGGVVNIILKKKLIGFDANLRSDYTFKDQGYYTSYNGLNFNYGSEKWNVYGNYNFFKYTGVSSNFGTIDYFALNDFLEEDGKWINTRQRHNYQLGFVTDFNEKHTLGLEGYANNHKNIYSNNNEITFFREGEILDNGKTILDGNYKDDLYNLTMNYTWKIDTSNTNFKFFADYSDQVLSATSTANSTYSQGFFTENTERNGTDNKTRIYALQADFEKYLKHEIKFSLGSKLTHIHRGNILNADFLQNNEWIKSERSNAFNYDEQVRAGYFSLNKKVKQYFFEVGLRMENTDLRRADFSQDTIITQNYTDWFPNVFLSKDLADNNTLTFGYSRRLRRPFFQFLNNYVIKISDFRYELGNPKLRPEYVHNFELSYNRKKQTIAAYYQKVNDAINGIYYLEDQVSFYRKFNSGAQTQYGITYNIFGNLKDWWFIRGSVHAYNRKFTEEDGTDKFKSTTINFDLMNNFKINATTNLEISGRYRSGYEDAFFISHSFYNVNVMLQKSFFNRQLNCRIYFNDIFNTLIYDNERPFENFKTTQSYNPLSQTVRLWVTYNFSNKNKASQRKNKSKNDARRRL